MNIGTVVAVSGSLYPTVSITVTGAAGFSETTQATLDTGFTGSIALPLHMVDRLGLEYVRDRAVTLADGSQRDTAIYRGSVMIGGDWQDVEVHCSGHTALVGMRLMYGANISFDAVPEGKIEYRSLDLPRPRWPLHRG